MFKKWCAIEFVAVRRNLKASPPVQQKIFESERRDAELNTIGLGHKFSFCRILPILDIQGRGSKSSTLDLHLLLGFLNLGFILG